MRSLVRVACCFAGLLIPAALLAGTAPAITTQPQNVSAALGSSAAFHVVATGTPTLGYQWLKDGGPIAGANSATYMISAIQSSDAGSYAAVVTNAYGSATSSAAALAIVPGYIFSTIAGTAGQSGSTDGLGAAARFNGPTGMAVDAAGNAYVADTGNDIIRKISPSGVVSTLAGMAGQPGSADGSGTNARFKGPRGIAVDSSGNLYVCDTGNDTIREISSNGTVTTLAGTAGVSGAGDGIGPTAQFQSPGSIAVDSEGNVYVLDANLRKISPPNATTTTVANLSTNSILGGLAADALGNVYVLDVDHETVTRYPASGPAVIVASGFRDFSTGLALDPPGNLYATSTADIVAEVAAGGSSPQTAGGTYGQSGSLDGMGNVALFHSPGGVAVNAASVLFIADTENNTIRIGYPPVSLSTRIVNLSVRAAVGTGNDILIAGFGIGGSGTKSVLLRGAGPDLYPAFNITDALPDAQLTLYDAGNQAGEPPAQIIAVDHGWGAASTLGSSPVEAAITTATATIMNSLGAFPYPANSLDSAMVATLPAGSYTAQISGAGGATGVALAEIYDADTDIPPTRLINVSGRVSVGTGFNVLIAGLVISGNGSETLLIRGDGPGLYNTFQLAGTLASPVLQLFDRSGAVIAQNSGWGTAPIAGASLVVAIIQPATAAIMNEVGAFPLVSGSNDAAMVVTLPAGDYTAELSGAGNTTGIGLIEVYELP